MKRKRIWLVCLFVAVLCSVSFYKPAVLYLVEWRLQGLMRDHFSAELSYTAPSFVGKKVVFSDVVMRPLSEGPAPGFDLAVKRFELRPRLSLSPLTLRVDVALIHPDLVINDEEAWLSSVRFFETSKRFFLPIETKLNVVKGSCRLEEWEGDALRFHFLQRGYSSKSGELQILWDNDSGSQLVVAIEDSENKVEIFSSIHGVEAHQLKALQELAQLAFPRLPSYHLKKGVVEAEAHFVMIGDRVRDFMLESFVVRNAELDLPHMGVQVRLDSLKGSLSLDGSSGKIWESLHASLEVEGGEITLSELREGPLAIEKIALAAEVEEGVLQKGFARWSQDGIAASLNVNLSDRSSPLFATLQGGVKGLVRWFPPSYRKMVGDLFSEETLDLRVEVSRGGQAPLVAVRGSVFDRLGKEIQPFECSLVLDESIVSLWKTPFDGRWGGWRRYLISMNVTAPALVLEKFLSPFLFDNTPLSLRGNADMHASLEEGQLVVRYTPHWVVLDHPHFLVEMPGISSDNGLDEEKRFDKAVHYVNLWSSHFGFLPVRNGHFVLKDWDMEFFDAKALIHFDGRGIQIKNVETHSSGMQFWGNIGVDFRDPKAVLLSVSADRIEGSVANLKILCSHFADTDWFQFPLEGKVIGRSGSLDLHTTFYPKTTDFDVHVRGQMNRGEWRYLPALVAARDLSMDFEYRFSDRKFEILHLEGDLFVGQGKDVDRYHLQNASVVFDDDSTSTAHYDLSLHQEDGSEYMRAVGTASSLLPRFTGKGVEQKRVEGIKAISFTFDPSYTHIGAVKPGIQELILNGDARILKLYAEPVIDLKTLSSELGRLIKTSLLPLSPLYIDRMSRSALRGTLYTKFRYDGESQLALFSGRSDDLFVADQKLPPLSFRGEKRQRVVLIDELQAGAWVASGLFYEQPRGWKIESLAVKHGSILESEFRGVYHSISKTLRLVCSAFVVDLPQTLKLLSSSSAFPLAGLKGGLRGNGELSLDLSVKKPLETLRGAGTISLQGSALASLVQFNTGHEARFSFSFPEGIKVSDIALSLTPANMEKKRIDIAIDCLSRRFDHPLWKIDGAVFSSSARQLRWIVLSSAHFLPGKSASGIRQLFAKVQGDDPIQLSVSGQIRGEEFSFAFQGRYPGIYFNLKADQQRFSSHEQMVMGRVDIDFAKLAPLFPAQWNKRLEFWQLGKGYSLIGTWTLPKRDFFEGRFQGVLHAKSFEIAGRTFEQMSAVVHYGQGDLSIENLSLYDPAMTLSVNAISCTKKPTSSLWSIEIPQLIAKDIQPKSFLQIEESESFKNLVVNHLELNNLSGTIGDRKSFTGTGHFLFLNNDGSMENTLWAIPVDIISRIGFDNHHFIPSTGNIHYTIKDSRIYLTKLKDIYSKGRRSQFYKAEGETMPYMDFDGNLNIKIRMKQHNLLMKIAELFTFSIQGTVTDPVYRFQRPFTITSPIDEDDAASAVR
ncbi:hypothetical protein JYU14_04490 [Simkania negevensis]|uniref:AsmA-like C-terminal domain-containing protein n=1 Tax=Simkania negevensis TaxID=83561 RepID=A0ABS3ARF4_9BACT|nr:hypothetical protein [Simkania negevensis]